MTVEMLLKKLPKPKKSRTTNYFSTDSWLLLRHCISSKRETWTLSEICCAYAIVFTGINFKGLTQVMTKTPANLNLLVLNHTLYMT